MLQLNAVIQKQQNQFSFGYMYTQKRKNKLSNLTQYTYWLVCLHIAKINTMPFQHSLPIVDDNRIIKSSNLVYIGFIFNKRTQHKQEHFLFTSGFHDAYS